MKLNSKYFDGIRIKPDKDRLLREEHPPCSWKGCAEPALYPAPKGRGREGQYLLFCLSHVRQYNKSYNYFTGMSDNDIADYQRGTVTGHRPTWSIGVNSAFRAGYGLGPERPGGFTWSFNTHDPFDLFNGSDGAGGNNKRGPGRALRNVERRCLEALNLDETASRQQIKARFKTLVKRHHPDANNGARSSEDKLREVIQAYNYLKREGLC